jgi:hypothetical protein
VVVAAVVSTASVGAFVLLAAASATATRVGPADEAAATRIAAAGVLVLAAVGALSRGKVRCLAFAAACAVAYGYVSLMMRGITQVLGTELLRPLLLVAVVTAAVLGAGLLQHGYASGPPELVVACLTVVDPLVAVGLGIGLLGEADRVATGVAAGETICAVTACAGVFALARHHPHSRERSGATPVTGGGGVPGDMAGDMSGLRSTSRQRSTDRPDGSTT